MVNNRPNKINAARSVPSGALNSDPSISTRKKKKNQKELLANCLNRNILQESYSSPESFQKLGSVDHWVQAIKLCMIWLCCAPGMGRTGHLDADTLLLMQLGLTYFHTEHRLAPLGDACLSLNSAPYLSRFLSFFMRACPLLHYVM